jgi:hypothetical protein
MTGISYSKPTSGHDLKRILRSILPLEAMIFLTGMTRSSFVYLCSPPWATKREQYEREYALHGDDATAGTLYFQRVC